MKGAIKADRIPTNKFKLMFLGIPELTPIDTSGLEEELETVELPDRTRASGGNTGPIEFTATFPSHHIVEQAALELWFREGQDPVSPSYKKGGSLVMLSITGNLIRTYTLIGVFITKRALPDLEMANEGEMAGVTFTFSVDDMLPI